MMRVCLALGLVLLLAARLFAAAAAIATVEVAASRGDIRSGPGAAREIMGEVRQGESTRPWRSAASGIEYAW